MKSKFIVQDQDDGIFRLEGVRLSFPNLWEPGKYQGATKPRLDSSFLIPTSDMDTIKKLHAALVKVAQTESGKIKKIGQTKDPKLVKNKDGENYILKTSNDLRYPTVYFNRQGKEVPDPLAVGADKELYAGCYVRIKFQANAQVVDGKVKVWVNLSAIQFLEHGEKFGGAALRGEELSEGFDPVEGEDDEFDDHTPAKTGGDDFDEDEDFDDDELEL